METVQMLSTAPVETTERVEEVKPVELKSLSKEDLINIIEEKDKVIGRYEDRVKELQEFSEKEKQGLSEYYLERIKELKSLVGYYERKIRILRDLINIETGDDK